MNASELIKQIQTLIDKHGDLPVELCTEKGLKQEEVKEICYGSYSLHSDKSGRSYIALYSWIQ